VLATAENSPVLVKYAALMAGCWWCWPLACARPCAARAQPAALAKAPAMEGAAGLTAAAQPVLKAPEPVELDPERIGRRRSSSR
jgi:hypothetical protein